MEAAKKAGTFKDKITPETVTEIAVQERLWESVAPILEAAESVPQERKLEALRAIVADGYKLGMSPAEIKEVAEAKWGKSAKNSVIESKMQEQEELRTGKKETARKVVQDSGALFFDDLM